MSAPRRAAGVTAEDVPGTGESVLLHPEGRVLALNATAAAVWELLDGARGPADLAGALAAAGGVPLAEARADVDALLARLDDEGFLQRS